ncbi:hypothetical protein [Candidatus Pristimantibacillus sp. PTI5]|uniref:hypothetical protein n=1 Tax=Candidatus Pristimantibacillus sp. PTI5 TaxID=3400422 RepID=UPI003B01145A
MNLKMLIIIGTCLLLTGGSVYASNKFPEQTVTAVKSVPLNQEFEKVENKDIQESKRLTVERITALEVKDLTLLESMSDLIVLAEKSGESTIRKVGGKSDIDQAVTSIKLLQVFKGEAEEGREITVSESAFFEDGSMFRSVSGYVPMVKGDHYTLFLQKDASGIYVPVGGYQGKFNLNDSKSSIRFTCGTLSRQEIIDNEVHFAGNTEHFNSLKEQIAAKYKQ